MILHSFMFCCIVWQCFVVHCIVL